MFLRSVVFTLKIITVTVVYFSMTLDVGFLPVCLNFSPIGESHHTIALFFTVNKIPLVNGAICISIDSPTIFLTSRPITFITVTIRIIHAPFTHFNIVLPPAGIYISIGVVIGPETLFTSMNRALEAFTISEQVNSFNKSVLTPVTEVDVP
jgi:hypothetical protein